MGTLSIDYYSEIISVIKTACEKSGMKYYEILIGKINEPKLKNIPYVIVDSLII